MDGGSVGKRLRTNQCRLENSENHIEKQHRHQRRCDTHRSEDPGEARGN